MFCILTNLDTTKSTHNIFILSHFSLKAMEVDSTIPEPRTTSQSTQGAAAIATATPAVRSDSTNGGLSSGAAAVGGAMAAEPVGTAREARVMPNWQAAVQEVGSGFVKSDA